MFENIKSIQWFDINNQKQTILQQFKKKKKISNQFLREWHNVQNA